MKKGIFKTALPLVATAAVLGPIWCLKLPVAWQSFKTIRFIATGLSAGAAMAGVASVPLQLFRSQIWNRLRGKQLRKRYLADLNYMMKSMARTRLGLQPELPEYLGIPGVDVTDVSQGDGEPNVGRKTRYINKAKSTIKIITKKIRPRKESDSDLLPPGSEDITDANSPTETNGSNDASAAVEPERKQEPTIPAVMVSPPSPPQRIVVSLIDEEAALAFWAELEEVDDDKKLEAKQAMRKQKRKIQEAAEKEADEVEKQLQDQVDQFDLVKAQIQICDGVTDSIFVYGMLKKDLVTKLDEAFRNIRALKTKLRAAGRKVSVRPVQHRKKKSTVLKRWLQVIEPERDKLYADLKDWPNRGSKQNIPRAKMISLYRKQNRLAMAIKKETHILRKELVPPELDDPLAEDEFENEYDEFTDDPLLNERTRAKLVEVKSNLQEGIDELKKVINEEEIAAKAREEAEKNNLAAPPKPIDRGEESPETENEDIEEIEELTIPEISERAKQLALEDSELEEKLESRSYYVEALQSVHKLLTERSISPEQKKRHFAQKKDMQNEIKNIDQEIDARVAVLSKTSTPTTTDDSGTKPSVSLSAENKADADEEDDDLPEDPAKHPKYYATKLAEKQKELNQVKNIIAETQKKLDDENMTPQEKQAINGKLTFYEDYVLTLEKAVSRLTKEL
eukprot:GHVT01043327.1.p1 GENE.GHVT01043327.1~~GHVT01043327.1.p1  ORF type:complete len:679 (-),score=112.97 GHVT01043327.1:8861-10897(-)